MIVESHKLTDVEAVSLEGEVGYVIRILPDHPGATLRQAMQQAAEIAASAGVRVGVFKLYAVAEPVKVAKTAPVLPVTKFIEQSRQVIDHPAPALMGVG